MFHTLWNNGLRCELFTVLLVFCELSIGAEV